METTMLSPADAMLLGQKDGFGDGNSWIWIILLFFLFGGGFGNRADAAEGIATRAAVNDGFQYNQLDNGIRAIQNGLSDGFYAINSAVKDCCCTTNRNIDSVRFDMVKGFGDVITAGNLNTRDILEANNAGIQRILDYLCANEKQNLRDRIQTLETSGIVQAQTRTLLEAFRPAPVPAYPVGNPYAATFGCGCGI